MLASNLQRTSRIIPRGSTVIARLYHKNVVDHYNNPRNVGSLNKNDPFVGTGLVGAPACGDVMKLQIKVDEEGNIIESCFKTFGCGSAIASSSVGERWWEGVFRSRRPFFRPPLAAARSSVHTSCAELHDVVLFYFMLQPRLLLTPAVFDQSMMRVLPRSLSLVPTPSCQPLSG